MGKREILKKLEELYKLAIEIEDLKTGLAVVDYMQRAEEQSHEKGDTNEK